MTSRDVETASNFATNVHSDMQFKVNIVLKLKSLFRLSEAQMKEQTYEALSANHASSLLGTSPPAASQRSLLITPAPSASLIANLDS